MHRGTSKQQLLYPRCPFRVQTPAAKTSTGQPHWVSCPWQAIRNTWSHQGVENCPGRCNKTGRREKRNNRKGWEGEDEKVVVRQMREKGKRGWESGEIREAGEETACEEDAPH